MNRTSYISSALLVAMLFWASVVSAQSQEAQAAGQGSIFERLVEMLGEMTDEEKAYARSNWLVTPAEYANSHDHPASYLITPNPAPDTQQKVECAACSSAYLLRFFGEEADGVALYHSETFP